MLSTDVWLKYTNDILQKQHILATDHTTMLHNTLHVNVPTYSTGDVSTQPLAFHFYNQILRLCRDLQTNPHAVPKRVSVHQL
jgi:hypothetical protein